MNNYIPEVAHIKKIKIINKKPKWSNQSTTSSPRSTTHPPREEPTSPNTHPTFLPLGLRSVTSPHQSQG
jgi:hypothetical protein